MANIPLICLLRLEKLASTSSSKCEFIYVECIFYFTYIVRPEKCNSNHSVNYADILIRGRQQKSITYFYHEGSAYPKLLQSYLVEYVSLRLELEIVLSVRCACMRSVMTSNSTSWDDEAIYG